MRLDKLWEGLNINGNARPKPEVIALMDHCFKVLSPASDEFNETHGTNTTQELRTKIDYPGVCDEPEQSNGNGNANQQPTKYVRLFVSTPCWILSVRAFQTKVEFFVFPAVELPVFRGAERPSRLKLKLDRKKTISGAMAWCMSEAEVAEDELTTLVLSLFKDIVRASQADVSMDKTLRESTIGMVKNLLSDRQRLMVALVSEQESTKSRLAMEIHDNVIGDLMYLKRSMLGERELSKGDAAKMIEAIADTLRSVCADLSPRDLKDWGLKTVLQDLVRRFSDRTGASAVFHCETEIPDLPEGVQLNIFRIVQECLTNAEKHAGASHLEVIIEHEHGELVVMVKDNGVGFDPETVDQTRGGRHLGSVIMKERTELISTQLPATICVNSAPRAGTTVRLVVQTELYLA